MIIHYATRLVVGRLIVVLTFMAGGQLCAQPVPIPEIAEAGGYYIFAVYTPKDAVEAPIWRCGPVEMTTHRVIDRSDSSTLRLAPAKTTVLRTYFSLTPTPGERGNVAGQTVAERLSDISPLPRRGAGGEGLHELLHYPTLLSSEQRQLTESYLALKYGLTLDQQRPVNYLAPATNGGSYPVWTATAEPAFRHRLLGLGQDDISGLNRLAGHSVHAPELLELTWDREPDTTAYLVIADNGAPTARTDSQDRLQRRWRVESHGEVPDTSWLRIDPRQLFGRLRPGESWVLAVQTTEGMEQLISPVNGDGRLLFPLPAATTHFQLAIAGVQTRPEVPATEINAQLNPNPLIPGQMAQLRVALEEPSGLWLSSYDGNGRLVEKRWLPPTSHHLTEVSFPASGVYTLHLSRSNRGFRDAPRPRQKGISSTLKIIVQ